MDAISAKDIIRRIRLENPWWAGRHGIPLPHRKFKPRAYFDLFYPLVKTRSVRRAVVLMGPRRVGKSDYPSRHSGAHPRSNTTPIHLLSVGRSPDLQRP